MQSEVAPAPASKTLLAVFWIYVLVPLAWGVINTISQAVKLFD
ncbi:MFS transporter small subunit [Caballeronia mineralivorans]|nr:oxalate:formate antiporter [Caballeronia mineralivorans]